MTFTGSKLRKCFTYAALALPLVLGTVQPARSEVQLFGHPYSGGPNANIPTLSSDRNRIIAACVDGWVDSVRCTHEAQEVIADRFCYGRGFDHARGWYTRRNARRRHNAFVYHMSYNNFRPRVATGHPLFFTSITCER